MNSRNSQIYPTFLNDQSRSSKTPLEPEKSPKSSSNEEGALKKFYNQSMKKHMNMSLILSIAAGMIIFGVPLLVFATLLTIKSMFILTPQSSSSGSSSGSSGSSSSSLPSQCTSYVVNVDSTRLTSYGSCSYCSSDAGSLLPAGWYRFMDGAGTKLSLSPTVMYSCGATYPAYFSGTLPTTVGQTTNGTACANYNGNLCYSPYSVTGIYATLCDSFYVFYLKPTPISSVRYCTSP